MSRKYDSKTTTFTPEGRLQQIEYAMEAINKTGSSIGTPFHLCRYRHKGGCRIGHIKAWSHFLARRKQSIIKNLPHRQTHFLRCFRSLSRRQLPHQPLERVRSSIFAANFRITSSSTDQTSPLKRSSFTFATSSNTTLKSVVQDPSVLPSSLPATIKITSSNFTPLILQETTLDGKPLPLVATTLPLTLSSSNSTKKTWVWKKVTDSLLRLWSRQWKLPLPQLKRSN